MNAKPLVLQISHTPLVGAPQKIARSLNAYTDFRSVSLVARDYPQPLKNGFIEDSILWDLKNDLKNQLALSLLEEAAVVHVHNTLPAEYIDNIRRYATRAVFVYQVHSGLREGPLFFERANVLELPFARRLTIGQAHPRHYPEYTMVPNIVVESSSTNLITDGQIPRLLFAPPHERPGRWNGKASSELKKALNALGSLGMLESIQPSTFVRPKELFELRRRVHLSIDEIVTGGFHQVSMEALAAGNVSINNADYFACEAFRCAISADEMPPFFSVSPQNCRDRLLELAQNPELISEYQRRSTSYFERYMQPERLIQKFVEVYEDVAS